MVKHESGKSFVCWIIALHVWNGQ